MQFAKRNISIAGRSVPALQIGAAETQMVELSSGKVIPAQFADLLSLRETNPANGEVTEYLTVTHENLRFTTLRFSNVIGLDVDADGTFLTIEDLETRRAADIAARQIANLARKAPALVSLDEVE
jgi:hypothetical protein